MLDKPHASDASPSLRGKRGNVRLPGKVLLSLSEAALDRLRAEADRAQTTLAAVVRQRLLQSFAEDDRRMGVRRPVERHEDEARAGRTA
jgi:hypothetical protein